jgi:hypothetical protein
MFFGDFHVGILGMSCLGIKGLTNKLTGPAATPVSLTDTQDAVQKKRRGRVRCSAWFGLWGLTAAPRLPGDHFRKPLEHALQFGSGPEPLLAAQMPGVEDCGC